MLIGRWSGLRALGAVCGVAIGLVAGPVGAASAQEGIFRIDGSTLAGFTVTFLFTPSTGLVTEFHFASRCGSTQTHVPQGMRVIHGEFSYTSSQIMVTGLIDVATKTAIGTARYVTPTCDSYLLHWGATATRAVSPVSTSPAAPKPGHHRF